MKSSHRAPVASAVPGWVAPLVTVLLFTPIFFQLDGRIFSDPETLRMPRRLITNLPIPFSVLACAVALVVFFKRWVSDRKCLLLMSMVPLMVLTSIIAGDGTISWPKSKLLLFQFAVPIAGFALGRQIGQARDSAARIGKWLLIVSSTVAAAELLSTWFRHRTVALSADVFGISIYGHLQYVPVIIMTAFVAGIFATWESSNAGPRRTARLIPLVAIMALYVAASMSMTSVMGLWMGVVALTAAPFSKRRRIAAVGILSTVVVLSTAYVVLATSRSGAFQSKYLGLKGGETPLERAERSGRGGAEWDDIDEHGRRPFRNMSERFTYWEYFVRGSTGDFSSFLFGHRAQPDIVLYPSAHNYYLDFLYNFGLIPLFPVIGLAGWTLYRLWLVRLDVLRSPLLMGFAFATFFLVFADNGLKVGMRQPYPGITTFFLWGVLTRRLDSASRRADASTMPVHADVAGAHAAGYSEGREERGRSVQKMR